VLLPLYAHVSRPLDRSALSLSRCPEIRSRRSTIRLTQCTHNQLGDGASAKRRGSAPRPKGALAADRDDGRRPSPHPGRPGGGDHARRDRREEIILRGEVPSPINPPSGCRFHPRCPRVMTCCAERAPGLKDIEGRLVACHLYEENAVNS
jgi:hypothetical protein